MRAATAIPCRVIGRARSSALVVSAVLALLLAGGCAPGHAPAVRPRSTKVEERIVLTRRPRDVAVEVREAAFHAAMVHLAAEIHSLPRPFEGRLVLAAWHPQGAEERLLADGFRLWCGRKQAKAARSGCESILDGDGRWLKLESREAMALSIAMSSVWDGAAEVVKGMIDPVALQAMLYTSLATCMALLLVPEPITKALMVAITVGLCTYLGWSTVWGILQGWKRLQAEAGAARTFGELSAAGERFGRLLGANTARVMVMVTAMALGSTAGAAISGPGTSLPAWGQAARLATAEGLAPALAAPVASVVVVGETLTIGMAAGLNVVMAAGGPGAGRSASEAPATKSPNTETAGGALKAVKVGEYTLTRTVAEKLAERPYLGSPLTLREIMAAGKPIPDPGGVAGALRWDVPGTFRGSAGTWELVVDPRSKTVLHWLFKSTPAAP